MPTEAWILEGASIGEGDEIANSLADRINTIQTAISNLPDNGALTSIGDETDKIDNAPVDGLSGASDSLAYKTDELRHHFHGRERWLGAAVSPSGETHVADRIGTTTTAFQADGGNNTWGAWLQVLGSDDTPADVGEAMYDFHRIQIVAAERPNSTHFVQIALAASGAAGLSSGDYTELVFHPQNNQAQEVPVTLITERKAAGTKAWLRCWIIGQNTGTMDFFIGLHEYEG